VEGEFDLSKLIPEEVKLGLEQYNYTFYEVTPDKGFKNDNNNSIARAIHDMYEADFKRVSRKLQGRISSLLYTPQEKFIFRILIEKEHIGFYIGLPMHKKWNEYLYKKCKNTWTKSGILRTSGRIFHLDVNATEVAELRYKRHHIFSLTTDRRDMSFYESLLYHSNELDEQEKILVTYIISPENHRNWVDVASQAYNKFKTGRMPRKLEFDGRQAWITALRVVEQAMLAIDEFGESILGNEEMQFKSAVDGEVSDLLVTGRLSNSTTTKLSSRPYKTRIIICSQCKNGVAMNRSLANSFSMLSEDNELELREFSKPKQLSIYQSMEKMEIGFDPNVNIMCMEEISKLISLPTVSIQEKFPQMGQIPNKEVELPTSLFSSKGIPFCTVHERGIEKTLYAPASDLNILCQSHVDLGVKGCGKTTRGINYAINWLSKLGYSAFVIDVADGKLVDGIRDGLPSNFREDHIIDLDFGNGDYPIALNWFEMSTKDLTGYKARQMSNKLSQALYEFVAGISSNDTTDRMERYLTAVSKATLSNPQNSLLDVFLALSSRKYREDLIHTVDNETVREQIRTLNSFSAAQAREIIQPILDRMHKLTNGDIMENCLFQRPKLDAEGNPLLNFRRWADGDGHPYFVGIRVPKEELLPVTTDRLVTYIVNKYWLSILTRYDVTEEERRPCLMIMDEPHQFLTCKMVWENMAREDRKWKSKSIFLAHNFKDFGELTKTFQDVGIQYSVYSSSKQTYKDLLEELSPFTLEELMNTPDRYYAVNKIKGVNGSIPAFLGKMPPPPKQIKDRSYIRNECSEKFGRPFVEVEQSIAVRKKMFE
jgi:hypothetical protein